MYKRQLLKGVGILESTDIEEEGRYRFFGAVLLFIRGVNQLFLTFLPFHKGGNQLFFSIFYFFDGVFTLPKPTFSIEFFVIDRLLRVTRAFRVTSRRCSMRVCFSTFLIAVFCYFLLIFANFYANELLEPASLKTCVRLSNE